ncbi:MAG TPA: universal stress protein [Spirochaetia bacterium]|nr:universal stress protein [Spirochaetaceae bacterium]HPE88528.1 universal stress protein [Spirochaetales bacterium]HRW23177.1 universal stress protein [Spirochaetia bacterium]
MTRPIRKIMVYVDGSEQSITAAQYAIVLAKSLGADLYALYVVDTRALAELVKSRIFLESEQEEYRRDLDGDASRYLNHVRELARRKGVPVAAEKSSGAVHVEIKAKVASLGIDLLVLGEISQIRSRRDELYNETERAMRTAQCPVLVAKGEDKIWDLYESLE